MAQGSEGEDEVGLEPALADAAARLRRLDRALEVSEGRAETRWTLDGTVLAAVRGERGRAIARAGAGAERELRGARDVEAWLEDVVRELCRRWPRLAATPARAPADDVVRLPPARELERGVLLTPEEIAAFRDA